jgi:hypothetical protein
MSVVIISHFYFKKNTRHISIVVQLLCKNCANNVYVNVAASNSKRTCKLIRMQSILITN